MISFKLVKEEIMLMNILMLVYLLELLIEYNIIILLAEW